MREEWPPQLLPERAEQQAERQGLDDPEREGRPLGPRGAPQSGAVAGRAVRRLAEAPRDAKGMDGEWPASTSWWRLHQPVYAGRSAFLRGPSRPVLRWAIALASAAPYESLANADVSASFLQTGSLTVTRLLLIVGLLLLAASPLPGADWQPAKGPLMTRWAKDVSPDKVHPEYPRPQLVRKDWKNLNGLWQLAFARDGEDPPFGKELGERILVPFPVESALSGVMKRAERLWYRRTFTVPKEWAGKRTLLHFGAVDWEANVWVNGKKLGTHKGGYDPFTFDVTDALKKEGEQELIVGVFDPTDAGTQPRGKQVRKPGGIYYTPTTGIWQTVWLEPVNDSYVESLKIVPDVDNNQVSIQVNVQGPADKWDVAYAIDLPGDAGKPGVIVASSAPGVNQPFQVKLPDAAKNKLWTPETPFLFGLRVNLVPKGGNVKDARDTVESYFGMRKIAVGKDDRGVTRLLLNGKFVFQVGPLDQGFWPDGLYTAPTDEALKFDVEITKKLGFNCTRKHVKVEPARWYYWCDKLGLIVWQDMPSGDRSVARGKGEITRTPESARQYELELRRLVDGLHNHPCIVMWVVFNEGWGQFDTMRITEWTKKHDPSRLVDCASGWNDFPTGDVHDIHVYPGPGAPNPEPTRAAVLGEFGGLGLPVDGHTWEKKTWGYRSTKDKEDLTRKYERLLRGVWGLKDQNGLSAAIYTQITDVETEANGLLTYDRAIIKPDLERVAAANKGDFARAPVIQEIVPTSREKAQTWRYTFAKPGEGWYKPGFDDSGWKEGSGGFGTKGTPGAVVRTEWKTDDVWLRRTVTLPEAPLGELALLLHHDEDAEVYVNGVLAAKVNGYVSDYEEVPLSDEARAALKPGKNVIAVHCHQTTGGQYVDVGLVSIKKPNP
jgi:hypothetical protein